MIKTINLNKYYNAGKSNEIHVINDVSLDFPDTGFVSLLGPSGCGKTTLLNAISGLDKVKSGKIIVGQIEMKKYNFNKWDDIRTKKIGYIFQNYLLLPELSVYRNLELVLKMLNVPNDKIEERIEYALKAVKMERFKKRKASQLSGGQMQRVAIARALVKSPKVIIADEPTGNLDESNTTQIMNILRKISRECLVVLVTHEPRLANFYSDRIIKLADGKIVEDYANKSSDSFEFSEDRNLYLKEYNKDEVLKENLNIEYFFKDKPKSTKIKIIYEKDVIYISADSEKAKIKFIDSENEIKILDQKKPTIKIEDFDEFDYHLEKLPENSLKSAIKFKEAFKMGFQHLLSFSRKQKMFLFAFALIAIFVVISVINFSSLYIVDKKDYVYNDKNIISIDSKDIDVDYQKLMLIKSELGISGYIDGLCNPSNYFDGIKLDFFSQTEHKISKLTNDGMEFGNIVFLDNINPNDIKYGSMPTDYKGIVIDKWILDVMMEKGDLSNTGLVDYTDLIGQNISLDYLSSSVFLTDDGLYFQFPVVISGISDCGGPVVFIDKELLYVTELFADEEIFVTSNSLRLPEIELADNEIYLSETHVLSHPVNSTYTFQGEDYIVKGHFLYESEAENLDYIVNDANVEKIYINSILNRQSPNNKIGINFYAPNVKIAEQKLLEEGITFSLPYEDDINTFNESRALDVSVSLTTLVVMLSASSIILYFLMRSSVMLRINQIGTYRAIGAKKRDMYKIFFSEIVLITSVSSLIGFLFISLTIWNVSRNVVFSTLITYPWYVALITILFIFLVNILAGLFPVFRLMRLTPTQIITKYDI